MSGQQWARGGLHYINDDGVLETALLDLRTQRVADRVDPAPYISAVLDALLAASIGVTQWHAEIDDPLLAAIALDPASTPEWDTPVTLVWAEGNGWGYGPQRSDGYDRLAYVLAIGASGLPEPAQVLAEVHRTVLGAEDGTDDYHRRYDTGDLADQLRRWQS